MNNRKLNKQEFLRLLDKREIFHGFELVNKFGEKRTPFNLGVPALLIKSISQFFGKSIDNLLITDTVDLYAYINKSFPEIREYRKVGRSLHSPLKRFARKNNLSFFGWGQYDLLEYYVKYYDYCAEQSLLPFSND